MDSLIYGLLFPVIFSLLFALLLHLNRKEESKYTERTTFRVQAGQAIRVFFLIMAILWVVGMVITAIAAYGSLEVGGLLVCEGILAAFACLCGFGYIHTRFTYCVVNEDHLLLVRLFRKNRSIPYERIAYLTYHEASGTLGGYDANGLLLFSFDFTDVGVRELERSLHEKGIPYAPHPFPTDAMKQTEEYKRHVKRTNRLVWGITGGLWGAIVLTVILLLLFLE